MPDHSNLKYQTYLLTVDSEPERREESLRMLREVPLLEDVRVISSPRDRADNRRGCFRAHQQWAIDLKNRSDDFAIVFEDDIDWDLSPFEVNRRIRECLDFLGDRRVPPSVLFLGHMPLGPMAPAESSGRFVKCRTTSLTHAMIVSRSFASRIATWQWDGRHFDTRLSVSADEIFAAYPMFVFQKDLPGHYSRRLDHLLLLLRNRIGPARVAKFAEKIFLKR